MRLIKWCIAGTALLMMLGAAACVVMYGGLVFISREEDLAAAAAAAVNPRFQRALSSRDGEILFIDENDRRPSLVLVSIAGPQVKRITPLPQGVFIDAPPAWSPDGSRVALGLPDGIHLFGVESSSDEHIGGGRWPVWSPSGRLVASVATDESRADHLYVYDLQSRTTTDIAKRWPRYTNGYQHYLLDLTSSPDGGWLAFVRSTRESRRRGEPRRWEINVVDANGHGVPRVVAAGTTPVWSPDAQRLAFVTGHGLGVVNRDGSQFTEFPVVTAPGRNALRPTWSPDGKRLAWFDHRGIVASNPDGSAREELTVGRAVGVEPAWSADGTRIAFVCESRKGRVCVMNADGSGLTELINLGRGDGVFTERFAFRPSWRPDGADRAAESTYPPETDRATFRSGK
jgi:Tol biopolymer transport system component